MFTKQVRYFDSHDYPEGCDFKPGVSLIKTGFTRGGVPYNKLDKKRKYGSFLELDPSAWSTLCVEYNEFEILVTLVYTPEAR